MLGLKQKRVAGTSDGGEFWFGLIRLTIRLGVCDVYACMLRDAKYKILRVFQHQVRSLFYFATGIYLFSTGKKREKKNSLDQAHEIFGVE